MLEKSQCPGLIYLPLCDLDNRGDEPQGREPQVRGDSRPPCFLPPHPETPGWVRLCSYVIATRSCAGKKQSLWRVTYTSPSVQAGSGCRRESLGNRGQRAPLFPSTSPHPSRLLGRPGANPRHQLARLPLPRGTPKAVWGRSK